MRRRLRRILDNQLHGAGVKSVVDEAEVGAAVLDSDWAELQAVSPLVQSASESINITVTI